MKEVQFKYNRKRIFLKSILLWIILFIQLGLTLYLIFILNERSLKSILIYNSFLSIISIPSLILHINYYRIARVSILTLKYNSISLKKGNQLTELNSSEISKIILHEGPSESKLPWWNHSWYQIIDSNMNSISINCYTLEISDLWQNSLSRRINSDNLERKRHLLPLMN